MSTTAAPADAGARPIVVGIGEAAAGDDAIGLLVAQALAARGLDARTSADASIVLPLLEAGHRVVIVDAIVGAGAPGTVRRLDPAALATGPAPLSSHGLGVAQVLELATILGVPVDALAIVGVAIDPPPRGPSPMSAAVAAALEPAADLAAALALTATDRPSRTS